jgi:outer membrane protein assembly factor BamC
VDDMMRAAAMSVEQKKLMNYARRGVRTRCVLGLLLAATALGGCKFLPAFDEVLPDKKKEYNKSESLPDLEVPPDLSSDAIKDTMSVPEMDGGTATYSTYQERIATRRKGAAPGSQDAGGVATGAAVPGAVGSSTSAAAVNEGTVTVRGTSEEIWPKLQSFWKDNGYALASDDRRASRMSTEWLENERQMTREKFELRAAAGKSGTTSLTLHRIAQAQKPEGEHLVWVDAPASGSISPWLGKLEAALSGTPVSMVPPEEREAQRAERDRETQPELGPEGGVSEILFAGEGKKYLLVGSTFADAWKNTGDALTKAGIEVEDKDESRGVYYVHYAPEGSAKPGLLSRLAFWRGSDRDTKHQVSITAVGRKSEVVVLDHKGNWENNALADRLLENIQSQLKQLH